MDQEGGHLWEYLQDTFGGTWEFMWNGEKKKELLQTQVSDLNIWVPFKWDKKYEQNNNRGGANGHLVGKWLEPCDGDQERKSRRSGTIILWSTVELILKISNRAVIQCHISLGWSGSPSWKPHTDVAETYSKGIYYRGLQISKGMCMRFPAWKMSKAVENHMPKANGDQEIQGLKRAVGNLFISLPYCLAAKPSYESFSKVAGSEMR